MTFGQRFALNIAPLLLRLGLAFIFIYAGAAKLFYADMPVQGESAAYLANAGVIKAPPRPAIHVPEGEGAAKDSGKSVFLDRATSGFVVIPAQNSQTPAGDAPTEATPASKGKPKAEPPAAPEKSAEPVPAEKVSAEQKAEPVAETEPPAAAPAPLKYSAGDFAEPVKVRRMMGLVLAMHDASEAHHWPKQLSSPRALMVLAWMAALTEFLGGWLILLGFLTRVWALGLAGTMIVAMWLTQIAPSIGVDHALLGFLPPLQIASIEQVGSWQTWQFQTIILMSSLAVVLTGPGRLSLDAMLFRRPDRDAHPKPPQDQA